MNWTVLVVVGVLKFMQEIFWYHSHLTIYICLLAWHWN